MWALIAIAPAYMATRTLGLWSGEQAVEFVKANISVERGESLEFRMFNEDVLIEKALQQPIFGWGGWGRSMAYCVKTGRNSITDGLWIIVFGKSGLVGLVSFAAVHLLPLILLLRRYPMRRWHDPDVAPAAALGVLLVLAIIDDLSNGMLNPIYSMAAGGLMALRPGSRGSAGRRSAAAMSQALPPFMDGDVVAAGHAHRAEKYAALGRMAEAEQFHRLALERRGATAGDHPSGRRDLAIAHERLARFLAGLGRREESEAAWLASLELRRALAEGLPGVPAYRREWAEARNDLAWALVNDPDPEARDAARAVELATQATEADPGRAAFWNTLGAALYRDGAWDAAVEALGKSARLGPNAHDLFFLAMAHARRGDPARARDYLARATARAAREAPGHEGLARLRAEAIATIDASRVD